MRLTLLLLSAFFLFSGCNKNKVISDIVDQASPLDTRGVGGAAKQLLGGDFRSLKVEVQYMPGFAPDAAALSNLQSFLAARLNKPDGITVSTKEIGGASNSTLSTSEISSIEAANRTSTSANGEAVIYILYTNGQFTQNNVLGVAYRATAVALFGKKIRDNSGGIGQPSRTKLETTVLQHEMGHLLGLVDIGAPMQTPHKDEAHGAHCNNQNCLMYYTAETTEVLGFLITGPVPSLDNNCLADLRAAGGK